MSTAKAFTDTQIKPIRFSDNLPAPLSSFIYDGKFEISRSVSQSEFDALVGRAKDELAASAKKPYADQRYTPLAASAARSFAWLGAKDSGFYTYKNGTAISFIAQPASEKSTAFVLDNVRARDDGEVPTAPGVCLPGAFVESEQPDRARAVGVTFRLKDHPDVLIFFHDLKVLKDQPKLTSRQKNEFVWTSEFGVGKAVKLHGVFPWQTVKLDGREGVGSFGTITRNDDSTDYGYLVTVQGDLNASTDTPDLLLYVERNASASQGKTPVTADELEKIGEEVAASIKRR
ncbi:T6SS immunity protein Tli4 family protein [Paraburkholderia tropica]|uniref:T6SS immunity protein Tli4 family protein n=1 Tax=Paraburkholderia tropica TaxID=92647 RepID=UPI002AAF178C|nr:T6SS immunity protein Tli4 family protein [Paraburkholderia tropica]